MTASPKDLAAKVDVLTAAVSVLLSAFGELPVTLDQYEVLAIRRAQEAVDNLAEPVEVDR